jgi:hypothetical protein
MRRARRKSRFVRRLVLGLAVAALVAPAAQARLDSGTAAQGNAAESAAVIQGDDKVISAPTADDNSGLIHGDDKVIAPEPDGFTGLIHGDDKVIAPEPDGFTGLIHGDDKVITPKPVYYTVAGLPLALQDDGNRVETPVVAVRSPGSFDWGDALIGAGVAFGAMLLLGGATLATRHVRPAGA